jgi:hypothetical protein
MKLLNQFEEKLFDFERKIGIQKLGFYSSNYRERSSSDGYVVI